ncbi:MAG: alkaline phosphatase family protein [Anaerolineales bacterium]|nr:alkaline phosphatase family protein [Anaerolineales bacterium]
MEAKRQGRVLIIGLDGASPGLVRQWQDTLPNLSRLMQTGSSGVLTSVVPPRSIPAWYCFATGMNPAKLGVFGFSQRRPGTYDYTFANFTFCQAPPFWHWLNKQQISSGIVHLPGTYPPQATQGFMVSGWPGPLNRGNLVYSSPATLSHDIDKFLQRPFELISPKSIERDNDAEMLAERLRILKMHGDTAHHLLQNQPWQVAVVVLSPLDRASHQFWRHMEPTHPQHDPTLAKQLGSALQQVYEASDAEVGRLLSLLNDEDYVFIVSDHGFGPIRRTFYLNEWLRQNGYLVLKEGTQAGQIGVVRKWLGRLSAPLFWLNDRSPLFRKLAAPFKKRALSNLARDAYVQTKHAGLVRLNHLPIDWDKTRAYSPDESSLYLNLAGRDPEGIVPPGTAATQLLAEIEKKLQQVKDPRTGESIPVQIHRKETVYDGRFLAEAPELIIDMDDYQTEVMAELENGRLIDHTPLRSGNHTPDGLLIAAGPEIAPGQTVNANLIDIAPTVLHLLGLAVPTAMDGQVCLNLFTPDSPMHQRAIRYDSSEFQAKATEEFTAEEAAQIEKQLRDLGYLN